ncbi:hypothetical protein ACWED2_11865 [Amycolatopsis sp. NPDC005003]
MPVQATSGSDRTSETFTVELDGLGHWWMLDDPARAAAMLLDFWNSL